MVASAENTYCTDECSAASSPKSEHNRSPSTCMLVCSVNPGNLCSGAACGATTRLVQLHATWCVNAAFLQNALGGLHLSPNRLTLAVAPSVWCLD